MRIVFGALFALAVTGCAIKPTAQDFASADFGRTPYDAQATVKEYMNQRLKDPESARYRFLNAPRKAWYGLDGGKYGYAVCAEINAKNSYGGYTGFQRSYFLLRGDTVVAAHHDGAGRYGNPIVGGLCDGIEN